jgi:AcrR family transcriptional regulator
MVEAADRIFTTRGYEAASMDDIAAACGVTKPMLYAYFGSKEGLFAACGLAAGEPLRNRLRDVGGDPSASPEKLLWRGLLVIFTRVGEVRDTWMRLYPPDGPAPAGALGTRAAMNRTAMTEVVAQLMRDAASRAGLPDQVVAQVDPLAHMLVGAVIATAGWWMKHPDESAELQALRVMNFAWKGLDQLRGGELWLPPEGAR